MKFLWPAGGLAPDRGIAVAIGVAVSLHFLLFVAARPAARPPAPRLVPPATRYLSSAVNATDDRILWSPVLFALPSELGFSRELSGRNQRKQPPFFRKIQPEKIPQERFMDATGIPRDYDRPIDPLPLMTSPIDSPAPPPPATSAEGQKRSAPPRVYVAPGLLERLEGGIVLPQELNKAGSAPWQVRADVEVSPQGGVNHVFLDQPVEPPELNSQVLQLLYRLRFKPGDGPAEGAVEIYSPAAETKPGGPK